MSGDNYIYGDNVNMYGGRNNRGIVKNLSGAQAAQDPAMVAALAELRDLVAQLRTRLPETDAALLDDSVRTATADPAVPAQERHRALAAIVGIASMVGTVGRPVAEAARAIIGMING